MAESCISKTGAVAYLVNCFSTFSILLVPMQFEDGSRWYLWPALILCAALSYFASSVLLSLIDVSLEERTAIGSTTALLPVAPGHAPEVSLPTLVFQSIGYTTFGLPLYFLVLYCSLLGLVDLGLVATDSLALYKENEWAQFWMAIGTAVLISLMNLSSLHENEKFHIALAACRIFYLCLWACDFRVKKVSIDPFAFLPIFLSAFMYQLPLTTIVTAYRGQAGDQRLLQKVVIIAHFVVYAVFAGLYINKTLTRDINPVKPEEMDSDKEQWLIRALLLLSNLATAQIYWKTFAHLLVVWWFGANLTLAKQRHSRSITAIEMLAHWPLYILYGIQPITEAIRSLYNANDTKIRFTSLSRLIAHIPLVALVLYWSFSYCYEKKLATVSESEMEMYHDSAVPKWAVTASKWVMGLACLVAIPAGLMMWYQSNYSSLLVIFLYENASAVCVFVLLIAWSFFRSN